MAKRSYAVSSGGGGGADMGAMIGGIVGTVIQFVVGLIMLTVVMDTLGDLLNDNTVSWTSYPGTDSIVSLYPLLMGVQMIAGSILMGMGAYRKEQLNLKMAIMGPIAVVLGAVLLPTTMDVCDDVIGHTDVSLFSGMSIFSIFPLLYVLFVATASGLLTMGASGRGPLGKFS